MAKSAMIQSSLSLLVAIDWTREGNRGGAVFTFLLLIRFCDYLSIVIKSPESDLTSPVSR